MPQHLSPRHETAATATVEAAGLFHVPLRLRCMTTVVLPSGLATGGVPTSRQQVLLIDSDTCCQVALESLIADIQLPGVDNLYAAIK